MRYLSALVVSLALASMLVACQAGNESGSGSLKVGDCYSLGNSVDANDDNIVIYSVVDCASTHDGEVFSVFDYPNASGWPGYEAIGTAAAVALRNRLPVLRRHLVGAVDVHDQLHRPDRKQLGIGRPDHQVPARGRQLRQADWLGSGHQEVVQPPAVTVAERTAYEVVVGIEIHVQLKTASKMFCSCSSDVRNAEPNTITCPVCLGLPGALPVINRRAVELVLATGIAIDATTPEFTRWDRKNYFYPDLPKGYQISQYDLPLAAHGKLAVETSQGVVEVGITRAHLEEDTARLLHQDAPGGGRLSLVDFNRSGVPLMEIVTDPVIHSAEAARRYAEELRLLLVTIGASDAAMEEGQMRVEANVSIRPRGTDVLGTRVEVKNMNSFRSVERAIAFEVERQTHALETGEGLVQETRGWDDGRGETYTMRLKEESQDYRYFPEPDLPPLRTDPAWLDSIRATMPELPAARRERYRTDYGLSAYDASLAANSGAYIDAALSSQPAPDPKVAIGLFSKVALRERASIPNILDIRPGTELAIASNLRTTGAISSQNAEEVYAEHLRSGRAVVDIVSERGLTSISDRGALGEAVDRVIAGNPAAVADYRAGKTVVVKFLLGQVMKETRGQADAAVVQNLIEERLAAGGDA